MFLCWWESCVGSKLDSLPIRNSVAVLWVELDAAPPSVLVQKALRF